MWTQPQASPAAARINADEAQARDSEILEWSERQTNFKPLIAAGRHGRSFHSFYSPVVTASVSIRSPTECGYYDELLSQFPNGCEIVSVQCPILFSELKCLKMARFE